MQEFQNAQYNAYSRTVTKEKKWTPPHEGVIKVNFDGAVNVNERTSGMEVVARDSDGMVVGAFESCVKDMIDPTTVEALAAVKALTFAKDMGFQKIILEGDALAVINKINYA